MHPSTAEKRLYWQTYCERVDPVIKIIHKPTIAKILLRDEDNFHISGKSATALVFAIYLSAATSLTLNEVNTYLDQDRQGVIQYYTKALEHALINANFVDSCSIETLQAFVFYLICSRHSGSKSVWSLTGLAMRLAQSIGLHRDGTKLGLSPLETQIRRLLWWHVW
jgi:hypothetical protein